MYAQPLSPIDPRDCNFYHVMDLPGLGVVGGEWDLRGNVDTYLGHCVFAGKSVLEIGPASGFLTAEMEKRGAAVVALELPETTDWDYVPYPVETLTPIMRERVGVMRRLKNSFWYTHAALGLRARLAYGSAYDIPDGLGDFDVAVLGSILLHCHSPMRIVEQCARRARTLVITEMYDPALDGLRACQLLPNAENFLWHTWWRFSPDLFIEFLRVMGFRDCRLTTHTQQSAAGPLALFTIVASRSERVSISARLAGDVGVQGPATIQVPVRDVAAAAETMPPSSGGLRASILQMREEVSELGALARRVASPVGGPPTRAAATAPASDPPVICVAETPARWDAAEREMQQCALHSLPLLPNEIRLDEHGLYVAGYAGREDRRSSAMAFFANGRPFDVVEHPIHDPAVAQRFASAEGLGALVRARMTRDLDLLRRERFWRFDASASGAYAPGRWRQAVHLMNPAFERFAMPPADNMQRVVGSPDATLFAMGGAMIFKNVGNWLAEHGLDWSGFMRVLDWGCGVGRLTRYLIGETSAAVTGIDIDPDAIAWCRANLTGGTFGHVALDPPTPFPNAAFDMVISVSVLTHLTERQQDLWLTEMHRITRPGALLFISVRGPTHLAYADTPGTLYRRIQDEGFIDLSRDPALDAVVSDPEYYRSILHSRRYIEQRWSRRFEILAFEDGIAALQDFVVLKRG